MKTYTYTELSETAKARARDDFRDFIFSNEEWAESALDNVRHTLYYYGFDNVECKYRVSPIYCTETQFYSYGDINLYQFLKAVGRLDIVKRFNGSLTDSVQIFQGDRWKKKGAYTFIPEFYCRCHSVQDITEEQEERNDNIIAELLALVTATAAEINRNFNADIESDYECYDDETETENRLKDRPDFKFTKKGFLIRGGKK